MTNVALELGLGGSLDDADLIAYLQRQRWFNARSREIASIGLVDALPLPGDDLTWLVLLDVRLDAATHDVYQLVLGAGARHRTDAEITSVDGRCLYEASTDPGLARLLTGASPDGTMLPGADGNLELHAIGPQRDTNAEVRPLGVDQSNTSVVVGDSTLVKMYRRLEAGLNPELEMLLFLTERDFAHIPHVAGWYSYSGSQLRATLGVSQRFLPGARDGWSIGLDEAARKPELFLGRVGRLGTVIAEMHRTLASDGTDPAFAPEEPTPETAGLLNATIEDEIEDLYAVLPGDDAYAGIAGRAEELRDITRSLASSVSSGRLIRTHGDLHLGQVLWSNDDWYVTDFEGEPDRSIAERRRKMFPLRDVAGLFRSIAYLVVTLEIQGRALPPDFETRARQQLLTSYRESINGTELLPSIAVQDRLLDIFELEKVLYELRYELQHRPDWVQIPAAGLARILDRAAT